MLLSKRFSALAMRLDRAGYPWYVRVLDWMTGRVRRLELLLIDVRLNRKLRRL
ncbi:MAG: hypothetical protein ACLP1X_27060 [Polyangiaceae bacterium]